MPSILFICTANQFRSPLAAACLSKWIGKTDSPDTWKVESAGTWTENGLPAAHVAIGIATRKGLIGLQTHRTRQVSLDLLKPFDLLIVMEAGQKEALLNEFLDVRDRIYMLSEIVEHIQYDVPDPARGAIDPERAASELIDLVEKGAVKITALAESLAKLRANGRHE